MNTSWWDALGKPVPQAQRQAALDLVIGEGLDQTKRQWS